MAKKENVLIEGAFNQFDERVKRMLDSVPKQLQAPVLNPPGGKKAVIKPLPLNPTGGI
mgnify:FL=1|jgi:hypothetical protein